MPLLDRYLAAVKFWLPKTQRDDIVAELAANLQSEIDDRAAALGRSLDDAETAALLKQHGSPILVASRFRQDQRTLTLGRELIGPILFPLYWVALKVTLVLILLTSIIPAFLLDGNDRLLAATREAAAGIAQHSLPMLGLVTLIFVLLHVALRQSRFIERWNWDPRNLPSPGMQAKQVRRSRSIAGIIVQTLFIVWWWNHGAVPLLIITKTGAQIHFAPVLAALYLPILLIMLINLAQHGINLVKPNWRWLPPLAGLITSMASLGILYPLLWTSPLISIFDNAGALNASQTTQLASLLSLAVISLCIGIAIVGTIYACRLGWLIGKKFLAMRFNISNGMAHS